MIQLFLILAMMLPAAARAEDEDCWNADKTFYNCNNGSGAAVGASAPLIGDTLESNPAALPNEPTPFGLEGVYSNRSAPAGKAKFSVSTIKGFDGIGFGIGAWSDGTFSAPNFPQHFLSSSAFAEYMAYEIDPPSVPGFRIGTSVLLPKGPLPRGIRFSVGGSVGVGRVSGQWSPQVGLLARIYGLGIGYSENYEKLSRLLPKTKISKFALGLQLWIFYVGYSYDVIDSSVNKTFANSVSARLSAGRWTVHGALKTQKDHRGATDTWANAGLQKRFGKLIGAGYEYGFYRYSHSAVVQLYF